MRRLFPTIPMRDRLQVQLEFVRSRLQAWLCCGLTPRQLAFTLALGFAIGCIPLLGVTTVICAGLALVLRLNMPAIQAANWAAMPLQILLLYPFFRLGHWLVPGHAVVMDRAELMSRLVTAPWSSVLQMSGMFGLALLAWLVTAGPALILMTLILMPLTNRVSKVLPGEELVPTEAE
jgi:uncharacterized protein (DUF2062 family)